MRCLFVTQDFPPDVGGIQTYAARLAPRLAARADALALLAPQRPGAASVDEALPFPVYRLPARPDLLAGPALAAVPVLARRHRIDVALHAQWPTVVASLLARQCTGYPRAIVCAAHGRELLFNPLPPALRGAYDALRRFIVTHTDHFLSVSRYTARK